MKIELFSNEKNRIFEIGILVDCFPIIANRDGTVCIDSSAIERKAKERNNFESRLLHIRTLVVCVYLIATNQQACVTVENVSIKLMNDLKVGRHVIFARFVYKVSLLFLFISCCR